MIPLDEKSWFDKDFTFLEKGRHNKAPQAFSKSIYVYPNVEETLLWSWSPSKPLGNKVKAKAVNLNN